MALPDKTEPKPAWKLLGQRANGAILQKSEIRMGPDDRLPELRGGQKCNHPIYNGLLQRTSPALVQRRLNAQ